MDKLECLRQIRLPKHILAGLSPKMLAIYQQRVVTEPLRELRRHPDQIKYPLLAIYCRLRTEEVTDTLVQMLFQTTHGEDKRAERRAIKEYVADIKRVRGKPELLYRIAKAAVEDPDGTVCDVIFPVVGEQTLKDLVEEFKASGQESGKGDKDRMVPFRQSFKEILSMHVNDMKVSGATHLFESSWKKQYTNRGIRKILQKYAKAADLEKTMSPHKLRHFLFTWLKKQGLDDAMIQPYSGHATRQSLEIYSRMSLAVAQE